MSKKILLVSPHSDDVLFSASKYLFNISKYSESVLFTIENNEKRLHEDELLCEIFGIKNLITSETLNFEDKSYYHYYKEMKCKNFSIEEAKECMIQYFGKDFIKELKKEIRNVVKKYKKDGFEIVTCLGVGHPTHWFVRECLEDLADVFYRDFPHSYKRKGLKNFEDTVYQLELIEEYKLDEDEHSIKWDTAKQIYKTQSSLLFFEQGYIKKNIPEQYYSKS